MFKDTCVSSNSIQKSNGGITTKFRMLDTSVKEGGFWDASNVVFLKLGGSTWACALW